MEEIFSQIPQILENKYNILLTTHERTDGDDLGAVLALAHFLSENGKKITLAIRGGVPKSLTFLPGSHMVAEDVEHENFDLLIVSGCSQIERIGNTRIFKSKIPIINFDHHPDNTLYGDLNVVDAEKSSVSELVYDVFKYLNWSINRNIATCLLTGIFTDTGSFMHSNTKASTLRASSDLMKKGVQVEKIVRNTYKGKDIFSLRAWGKAFSNTWINKEMNMIYSILTEEDLNNLGNPSSSVFEGFVETLNKVPSAKFALFLKQDGPVIKGSLRSDPHKGIDVRNIAKVLGGGGHKWASGFSIAGKLVKDVAGRWRVQPVLPEN